MLVKVKTLFIKQKIVKANLFTATMGGDPLVHPQKIPFLAPFETLIVPLESYLRSCLNTRPIPKIRTQDSPWWTRNRRGVSNQKHLCTPSPKSKIFSTFIILEPGVPVQEPSRPGETTKDL